MAGQLMLVVLSSCALLACAPDASSTEDEPLASGLGTVARAVLQRSENLQPIDDAIAHPTLASLLLEFERTRLAARQEVARRYGLDFDGRRVHVELRPALSVTVDELARHVAATYDVKFSAVGYTVTEAWVDADQLTLVAAEPWVASINPRPRDEAEVGPSLSQGVVASEADAWHCRGKKGHGLGISVLDIGFAQWDATLAAGELPNYVGVRPSLATSTHGTAVSEIVADMAPEANLRSYRVGSLASTEAFVRNELPRSGARVLSRSLSSIGGGFGSDTGAWCDLARRVKSQGVLWVNSAGNYADKAVYRGAFHDSDGDGWHEYQGNSELNRFSRARAGRVHLVADWDAYPVTGDDFDLYLYRQQSDGSWVEHASSRNTQDGSQAPYERISAQVPAGEYAVAIRRKSRGSSPTNLRIFAYRGGRLSVAQAAQSLNTAAACADVVAVAALPVARYQNGPQSSYSSQGPTFDGRIKPDIAGPTVVNTSVSATFNGTSAAAPHVAAAAVLYASTLNVSPLEAIGLLKDDARAMPVVGPSPNNVFGAGALRLDAVSHVGGNCAP